MSMGPLCPHVFLERQVEVVIMLLVQEVLTAKQENNSFRAKTGDKDTQLEKNAQEVTRIWIWIWGV